MTTQTPVATGAVIESLEGIKREIRELAKGMESPAPGMFRIVAANRTHVRMRVREWVIALTTAAPATVALTVGTAVVATVTLTLEVATLVVPLPITIERATDVVTVASVGTVDESFLVYYPE